MHFAVPVVLYAVAALAQTAAPAPDKNETPPAASAGAEKLGPGKVAWASSVDEAEVRAAKEGRFLFVEFTREKCGNCERMDALLYPAFDFEALMVSMVPVRVDIDSTLGQQVAGRYGVKEPPAIIVTTPEGRLVFLMEGFFNQADFFRRANSGLQAYRRFAEKVEAQDVTKLTAKEALQTGSELFQRSDAAAALPRLRRAVVAPGATALEREDALELLAAAELELGQPAASRKTIERLIATTKDPAKRERAELFRAQIPLAENRPAEALALFRRFQKEHPKSQHIGRVNELVEKLEERVGRP